MISSLSQNHTILFRSPDTWNKDKLSNLYDITHEENARERYVSWIQIEDNDPIPVIFTDNQHFATLNTQLMKKLWHGVRLDTIDTNINSTDTRSMIPKKLIKDKLKSKIKFKERQHAKSQQRSHTNIASESILFKNINSLDKRLFTTFTSARDHK